MKFYNYYVKENSKDGVSTDSKTMLDILSNLQYVNIPDNLPNPTGQYLHLIELKIKPEHENDLIDVLEKNNWYISRNKRNGIKEISKKYIPESKVDVPKILYHATPTKKVESILRDGLKPKSEDLRHHYPLRIYVMGNLNSTKALIKELKRYTGEFDYTILEINTDGLSLNLYKDPTCAYIKCYYIQDINKIPPENITIKIK